MKTKIYSALFLSMVLTFQFQSKAWSGIFSGGYVSAQGSPNESPTPPPDGSPSESPDDCPSILAVNPNVGPTSGGQQIIIQGVNFQPGASVTIDGHGCSGINVISSNEIEATTPPGTLGPKDVVVRNPSGCEAVYHSYTYDDSADNNHGSNGIPVPPTVNSTPCPPENELGMPQNTTTEKIVYTKLPPDGSGILKFKVVRWGQLRDYVDKQGHIVTGDCHWYPVSSIILPSMSGDPNQPDLLLMDNMSPNYPEMNIANPRGEAADYGGGKDPGPEIHGDGWWNHSGYAVPQPSY